MSTILILGLAGTSAMARLLRLIPRDLPHFRMAPRWAALSRPLALVLFAIDALGRPRRCPHDLPGAWVA